MLADFSGFFLILIWLTITGVGPMVWLIAPERSARYALALAPAAGLAIISLVSFPLVRYAAPVKVWAWPVGAGLALISLVLLALDWRQRPQRYLALRAWSGDMLVVACLLLCTVVVASPLLLLGIQYRIFRTNPSDAFNYMSLAETLRVTTWPTLLGGLQLQNNQAGLAALSNISPTALFAARFVLIPTSLNKMAALAWMAEIAHIPVTRAYFLQHLLSFAVALPVVFAVAGQLTRSRALKLLAASAVALGFWARLVLEMDSGSELSAIPLGLLFVAAWIELEQVRPQFWSRSRLWLGVALAAIVTIYFPLVIVLAAAFFVYYGLSCVQRLRPLSVLLFHAITLLVVIVTLGATGQLGYQFHSAVGRILNVGLEARNPPTVVNLIKANGLPALWGVPESVLLAQRRLLIRWPLREINEALALALTAGLALTGLMSLRRTASAPARMILALLAGAGLVALDSAWQGNLRTVGKAFTYVYPYLTLSVLLIPQPFRKTGFQAVERTASLLIGIWLAYQSLLGPYLTYSQTAGEALDSALYAAGPSAFLKKGKNFDLSPIEDYLNQHPPHSLLITIPRDVVWTTTEEQAWPFAFYAMFAFSRYPHYFQSGIIIDNSLATHNLWFGSLTQAPDYAVIQATVDYIGPDGLGVKVAQTDNLALYRITTADPSVFNQHEQAFQGAGR